MSKAMTLSRGLYAEARQHQIEALQSVVVLGCAAALIFAGQPIPL